MHYQIAVLDNKHTCEVIVCAIGRIMNFQEILKAEHFNEYECIMQ